MQYSTVTSRPMGLEKSEESQIYALFAVALALTNIGIYIGMQYGTSFLTGGYMIVFLLAELLLIFTSSLWAKATPLNYLFFALFPLLSGFTITPYVMSVLTGYANGGTILMNAFAATVCMAGASAVFAKSTSWNLGVLSKGLFLWPYWSHLPGASADICASISNNPDGAYHLWFWGGFLCNLYCLRHAAYLPP